MTWKNGQWRRTFTYGGKLTENFIQALSRQILTHALNRVDDRWPHPNKGLTWIVLSVYDEIVCEAPIGMIDKDEFREILVQCPGPWANVYPLNADCWQGKEFRK